MRTSVNRPFESIVLNVACIIGAIRMLVALYRDFLNTPISDDILLDLGLFLLFAIPLTLYKSNIKLNYISIPFSIILGVLVSVNWLVTGGIEGTAEYNMVAIFFLFAMLFRGTTLLLFLFFLALDQVFLLYLWYEKTDLIQKYIYPLGGGVLSPTEPIHFVLMAVAVTISMFYLKNKFDDRRIHLEQKKYELSVKSLELDEQNWLLSEQKKELELINEMLEEKVDARASELSHQNGAIEEYLYVSLKGINDPLQKTFESIDVLQESHKMNPMVQLLVRSTAELKESIADVANKLKDESSLLEENN